MDALEIVRGAFEDYWHRMDDSLEGLTPDEVFWRPDSQSNSIAFMTWHVARVEDGWMTRFVRDEEHLWVSQGWYERFGMGQADLGLSVSLEWLDSFPRFPLGLLDNYRHAVRDNTKAYLDALDAEGWNYVPGRTFVPEHPVTLERFGTWSVGRMFRQLLGECNQHLGQVRYVRGMQRGLDG